MRHKILIPLFLIAASLWIFSGCEEDEKNKKPTCTITNPAPGAKIPKDSTITISAEAEDTDGKVDEVRLYIDNSGITEILDFPFEYDWNTGDVSTGTHILKVRAFDNKGAFGEDTVQILIGTSPDADFKVDKTEVHPGTTINFADQSTGNPTSWAWHFGDG